MTVEWRALAATFALAVSREEYTHILLVIPISAALIFLDRGLLQQPQKEEVLPGLSVCTVAVAFAVFSGWSVSLGSDVRLAGSMLAFVLWCAGAFVVCFGGATRFLFPLGFLILLVPLPSFIVEGMVTFLQRWSAFSAQLLFTLAGVPVSQDGLFLTIPGLTLKVATECSSIRSSLMLLVTTVVLAQLELRSFWKKALLVALTVPLAVAKNGLRIFTIAMLGTRVDPGYLSGRLHRQGGVVFLVLSLLVVFLLLHWLRRGEKQPVATPSAASMMPSGLRGD